MLDVDRGKDVDPGCEQLFYILPTLRVPASGRVGVGKLVHKRELRPALEDRINIHLGQRASLIIHLLPRHDRHALEQRLCLGASMRFNHADDHVDTGLLPRRAFSQHFVGLTDAGSRAEEDLQTAAALLRSLAKEGLR